MKFLTLLFLTFSSVVEAGAEPPLPYWIWAENSHGEPSVFEHEFVNDGLPDKAVVRLTGDFCVVELSVNGTLIGTVEAFDPVTEFDVLPYMEPELNSVSLTAYPVNGPSAIAATLTTSWDGNEVTITTDEGWSRNAHSHGPITSARWSDNELRDVEHSAEYNQWKEAFADASAVELSDLPEGFRIETIKFASEDEDSWVSLAVDERDRLYIGMEKKGILRLTPGGPTQKIKDSEIINDTLEECRGLVFHEGDLYANANDTKALYRLRDTTGDDQFDEVTLIQKTEGSVGHGRNDLALGPDWTIHAIHGDSVEVPDAATYETADEDVASKPLGHWLSIGPDAKEWKIHSRGLRNPYGLDFNNHGEAFTYDADNEGDVGLPFYRPSRINHLVLGANYGWWQRPGNTRSLPVYAPDSVPTTFDVGRGSPTSVKFGYRSRFPPPWQGALFALDWSYGRIIAVHLTPRGASYYGSGTEFLTGRPLNVTDLDFDSHGRMYFITGGRKTRSALFRLDYQEEHEPAERASPQARARETFSLGRREIRKRLETNGAPITPTSECWTHLSSADPWLKNAARVRLERRPLEEWRDLVSEPQDDLGKLTAFLALVRQGNQTDRRLALSLALELSTKSWRRPEKLTLLRIAELAVPTSSSAPLHSKLRSLSSDWIEAPNHPVTREVIRILALFGSDKAPSLAMDLFTKSETQEDKLFYLERLSEMSAGWTHERRVQFFKALAITRDTSRGDRFMPPFFQAIEERAIATLQEEQIASFSALLQGETQPRPTADNASREFVRNWTSEDFDSHAFTTLDAPSHDEGLSLYRAGLCHHCHTFGGEGIPIGPDLSRVGSRFTPIDLARAILHPSEVISEVYRNTEVSLKDGSQVIGRLMRDDFRGSTLHFSTNPFDASEQVTIPKSEIDSLNNSNISPMPPHLLSTFTAEEVVTLIQWLSCGPRER